MVNVVVLPDIHEMRFLCGVELCRWGSWMTGLENCLSLCSVCLRTVGGPQGVSRRTEKSVAMGKLAVCIDRFRC